MHNRPLLVILGSGFGAFNIVRNLKDDYDITVISPRNHFLFTPLLPSTTVGTLEFRSIIEPIRHARRDLRFYHASAEGVDPERHTILCRAAGDGTPFETRYDLLVIAVGAVSDTFGIPGVAEHALFLKDLQDARAVRRRIVTCFEQANLPNASEDERRRLLHFVVCGGGPTGVEFAAELHDFLREDLQATYPSLLPLARITLVEATEEILGAFDRRLRHYTASRFRRSGITLLTNSPVVRVEERSLTLRNGTELSFGLLLWSTGNGPTSFARAAPLPKDSRSRILTDATFRVEGSAALYAIGDCSAVRGMPLPATAQVAQQQGKYLAHALNVRARGGNPPPFTYRHLGMLAYIGGNRALADLQSYKQGGWATWVFWRSAYLTRLVSLKNKVKVLTDWTMTRIFGRDISQF